MERPPNGGPARFYSIGLPRFSILMPGDPRSERAAREDRVTDGAKQVLVVDDDPDVLRSFMRLLGEDADVKIALGAEAALKVLESKPFDVIIVDFNMTGPNGGWLLRQVRERHPKVTRVLLSGSSYSELTPYLEPELVDHFLEKPIEAEELIEIVGAG